jgi:hypothetical protein
MTEKEAFQTKLAVEINVLLQRVQKKSENFFNANKDTYYGDLGYVVERLRDVDEFLNDKYLTPQK